MYHQFVIRIDGFPPKTMKTKYRSYDRAMKALRKYVKEGFSGCMVTISCGGSMGYGLMSSKEF